MIAHASVIGFRGIGKQSLDCLPAQPCGRISEERAVNSRNSFGSTRRVNACRRGGRPYDRNGRREEQKNCTRDMERRLQKRVTDLETSTRSHLRTAATHLVSRACPVESIPAIRGTKLVNKRSRQQIVRDVRSLLGSVTRIRKTLTALYAFNDDLTDASARRSYIIAHARTHYIYVLGADTRKTRVKCIKKATVRKLPRELPWRCQHQGGHIVQRRDRCCYLGGGSRKLLSTGETWSEIPARLRYFD